MRYLSSKLTSPSRRSPYMRLDDDRSSDSEETPKSNKSEKPSGHQVGNEGGGQRLKAKGTPPRIPGALKNATKPSQPASQTQELPLQFTPLLKVFGLSEHEAVSLFEGVAGRYLRRIVERIAPFDLDKHGQLRMPTSTVWDLTMALPKNELRFKLLAALPSDSLVAFIKKMEAWGFHHAARSWDEPMTNDRLAAMEAFDETYTKAFMDRLDSAWAARKRKHNPSLEELGLLLAAAPLWIVGDLFKVFATKKEVLESFRANPAFDDCWKAAEANVTRAEKDWRAAQKKSKTSKPARVPKGVKSTPSGGKARHKQAVNMPVVPTTLQPDAILLPHVRALFKEMDLSDEEGAALINTDPSLSEAIKSAEDRLFDDTVVVGDKLSLFRALADAAPALAWRYLSSTKARSALMGWYANDVETLLKQMDMAAFPTEAVRKEKDRLVQSIVALAGERDQLHLDDEPARLLVAWLSVLPPSVRIDLIQKLGANFADRIDAWTASSPSLKECWQQASPAV